MTRQRNGLMVLRLWIEEDSAAPVRVAVSQTFDLAEGPHEARTFTDIEEVLTVVRTFLETGSNGRSASASP